MGDPQGASRSVLTLLPTPHGIRRADCRARETVPGQAAVRKWTSGRVDRPIPKRTSGQHRVCRPIPTSRARPPKRPIGYAVESRASLRSFPHSLRDHNEPAQVGKSRVSAGASRMSASRIGAHNTCRSAPGIRLSTRPILDRSRSRARYFERFSTLHPKPPGENKSVQAMISHGPVLGGDIDRGDCEICGRQHTPGAKG